MKGGISSQNFDTREGLKPMNVGPDREWDTRDNLPLSRGIP